jgi:hypothetical protein
MKTQPPGEVDWRRRHALNMAGMLPENVTDAIVVLDLLKEIVVSFLHVDLPEPETVEDFTEADFTDVRL